ncbi:MAG: hypothetical protein IT212_05990 [Bacteroidia bacterium]|nr:hypothetical protein [Bacteroidia bacterium]
MAKKPDIGSKEFTKLLSPFEFKPNKEIIRKIDSKMFSLDLNKVYNHKPEHLATQEFSRCLSLFQIRNPDLAPMEAATRLFGVGALIMKAESKHTEELQDLAINIIKEIYEVPDYLDIKAMISPRIQMDTSQDHNPESFLELTLEQKKSMRDEIQKRIILNGLVHGSSMHIWKGVYHLASEELNKINPSLKELYDYYTSTLGIAIWLMNPDQFQEVIQANAQQTQGMNQLKFDREKGFGGSIEAEGVNFPTLIHEINKGILDWLISAGIPQEYSEQELKYYYSKADTYENEFWHYILSPSLWLELLDCAQIDNHLIPKLISRLTKLSYQELVELFHLIQDNKPEATKKIKSWNK